MKRLNLIILTLALASFRLTVTAQPNAIFFDHFTSNDGLSNNDVKKVYKDRKGFVWVATEYGLNRYDGKSFRVFRHSEKDSNSLLHNIVTDIFEDDIGYLWIGTAGGVCRYNPMMEEFQAIPFHYQLQIDDPGVSQVIQNPFDKSIWVCSGEGLFRVNKTRQHLERVPDNVDPPLLTHLAVSRVFFQSPDEVWLATSKGLLLYNPSKGHYISYFSPLQTHFSIYGDQRQADLLMTCLYPDKRGRLWIGTWGAGLLCFDLHQRKWNGYYLPEPASGIQGGANIILDITQSDLPGEEDLLWVASETSSLLAFNPVKRQFYRYKATHRDDRTGVFESARSLYYSKAEGLWIASTFGLYRYDPNRQLFREYPFKYPFKTGCLTLPFVAYADPADSTGHTLWLGIWNCGLYQYDLPTATMKPLPRWLQERLPRVISVLSLIRDHQGIIWIGTAEQGLLSVDEKRRQVNYHTTNSNRYTPFYSKRINVLCADKQQRLWIGTDSGFYVLDAGRKNFHPITWEADAATSAKLSFYSTGICFDQQGNTWISLSSDRQRMPTIGKIVPGSFTARPFIHHPGDPNSFPEAITIRRLACDNNNTLWCSGMNGLISWSSNDPAPVFKRYTDEDGLIANTVYKLLRDRDGRIWSTTVGGLSMYDPDEKRFHNFHNVLYGLDKENTSQLFYNPITNEVMLGYFGKMYGLAVDKIARPLPPPNIVITDFKVDNTTYFVGKKTVTNGSLVWLKPEQNMISIEFAALSFTNAQQNRYAYKLDGVDRDWVYTANNFVSYKLTDGQYTFRVKACNADGIWSYKEAFIDLKITPPFYKTWWFIAACAVLLTGLLYGLYRMRISKLKAMYEMRNVIARDLHDEIGSTLTSINILSQVSQSNMQKDQQKASSLLEKVVEQSEQIQQNMSDIVWAIKPDNDKIQNLAVRMREYLSHTLESREIRIEFHADERVMKESLTMKQRRDFFLIFKEAVNNAAKYSQCRQVTVVLDRQNGDIRLLIEDDGIGFDRNRIGSTNGLRNMEQRAVLLKGQITILSTPEQGTRITLTVPAT